MDREKLLKEIIRKYGIVNKDIGDEPINYIKIDLHYFCIPPQFKKGKVIHPVEVQKKFLIDRLRHITGNRHFKSGRVIIEIVCGRGSGTLLKEVQKIIELFPELRIIKFSECSTFCLL